ncbi:MAG: cation:proton antiporter subunit C [Lachnospiraceae bacterium]|nr:cation:proton antiporter subunit C [Lachnospiraceae bacterium]
MINIIAILMFFISFFGLITSHSMIKSIVFTVLMESAVILFFLSLGFQSGIIPPIGVNLENLEHVADPLPQALMITAIIIGVAVTTIKITILMSFFRKFKTTDWDEARILSHHHEEDENNND